MAAPGSADRPGDETEVGFLVSTNVATRAGVRASEAGAPGGGSVLAWTTLRDRLGGLDGGRLLRTTALLCLATVPGAALTVGLNAVLLGGDPLPGVVAPAVATIAPGSLVGVTVFVVAARLLRVTEVTTLLTLSRTRLLRRRGQVGA